MRRRWFAPILFTALSLAAATSLSGCGGLRSLAKAAGVKTQKVTLKTSDLGPDYKKFDKTKWDFFGKQAGKNRIKITYEKVGVKSVDEFNGSAAKLYGQYRFADRMLTTVTAQLGNVLKLDVKKNTVKEVTAAIRKRDTNQIGKVRDAKELKDNIEVAIKTLTGLLDKAVAMKDAGSGMISKVPGEMAKDPARALVADVALKELKTSVDRCTRVIKGSPKLLKKLTNLKGVVTGAF